MVLNPAPLQIMAFQTIVGFGRSELRGALPVEFGVAGDALAIGHRRVGAGQGKQAHPCGIRCTPRPPAGPDTVGSCGEWQLEQAGMASALWSAKVWASVELLGVAGLADVLFGLNQMAGLVAAVAVVAKQTLAHRHFRVWLFDGLAVFLMAGVTRFGLCRGQQRRIRLLVVAGMAVGAASLRKGLVGMTETLWLWQIRVATHTSFSLDHWRLLGGVVRLVTGAALHRLIIGVAGEAKRRVNLLFVTGPTQIPLRFTQNGRLIRTMREMAKVALALGHTGMRLLNGVSILFVASIAYLRNWFDQ